MAGKAFSETTYTYTYNTNGFPLTEQSFTRFSDGSSVRTKAGRSLILIVSESLLSDFLTKFLLDWVHFKTSIKCYLTKKGIHG